MASDVYLETVPKKLSKTSYMYAVGGTAGYQFSRAGTQLAKLGDTVKALQVLKGSPADKAGIQAGDVILAVDDKPISSWEAETLRTMFEDRPVGTKIKFEIMRDGKKKKATVTLADMI